MADTQLLYSIEQLWKIYNRTTRSDWVISSGTRGFRPGHTIFAGSEAGRVILETASLGASHGEFEADARFAAIAHNVWPALLTEVSDLRRRTEQAEAREQAYINLLGRVAAGIGVESDGYRATHGKDVVHALFLIAGILETEKEGQSDD